jgi:hypothetical protein
MCLFVRVGVCGSSLVFPGNCATNLLILAKLLSICYGIESIDCGLEGLP